MCGIVCAISSQPVLPLLIEGLKRLEYRGYDSAGVALLDENGFERTRSVGRIADLEAALGEGINNASTAGIAHTRWATHGAPTQNNAHPHLNTDKLAIVHNGIIENHQSLREELIEAGYVFESETDTEVILHEVDRQYQQTGDLYEAVRATVKRLKGAYAIGLISSDEPRRIIGARSGSPMVVGLGEHGHYIASDMAALLSVTRDFYIIEDNELVEINDDGVRITDLDGKAVQRKVFTSDQHAGAADLGQYRHYMHKEIHEQAQAVSDTLEGRIAAEQVLTGIFGAQDEAIFKQTRAIQIIACGTSYHAGLVAQYWFEKYGIACRVEIASEFRSRQHTIADNTLLVTLSQSGETIDTLAALKIAKQAGVAHTLTICNAPESSLVRESELVFMTHAGPEIGVASTKAFTTQLVSLLLLVVSVTRHHRLTRTDESKIVKELRELPAIIDETLRREAEIAKLATLFADKENALFLGRGTQYPIAMEGALKLKEISYIHAEAYAAGELKHGPLALVDEKMPVIAVAPNNRLLEKLKSNIEEVRARGGRMLVFADDHAQISETDGVEIINVGRIDNVIAPIVFTIPLQLLAYHVALIKGTDVDKPRNLAKSVTVE
jgi:glucosamine--fructose-6-phosphate aminotransferase (isomerizing)